MTAEPDFIPLDFQRFAPDEMQSRSDALYREANRRRTTRHFSTEEVPRSLIEAAIRTAGTAPSGAHLQPWTFVAIRSETLQAQIRERAEDEERKFYAERASDDWLEDLAPLGTDAIKHHLTDAPWVVVLFKHTKHQRADGRWSPTYYASESVGIAAGFFILAIHHMGLCTLPHTPSPMGFLREVLARPAHETPILVMPVGFPADGATVPNLGRKPLEAMSVFFDDAR